MLESVVGHLDVRYSANLTLPSLETCGKLSASDTTALTIPLLTSVGLELYAENSTNLTLPSLTSCGYLNASDSTGLIIPAAIVREYSIPAECLAAGIEPPSHRTATEIKEDKAAKNTSRKGIK